MSLLSVRRALFVFGLVAAGAIPAQQLAELRMRHLRGDRSSGQHIAAADLDRDGDVDLVISHLEDVRVYLNAAGVFEELPGAIPFGIHLPDGLALGDVDGDRDPDLLVALPMGISFLSGAQDVLLRNDGSGRFTDASAQLPRAETYSHNPAFLDFEGDGDLDLTGRRSKRDAWFPAWCSPAGF